MNKNKTTNSNDSKSSKESIHVIVKSNSNTPKTETNIYRVKERNIGLLSKGKLKKQFRQSNRKCQD